jgi:hypothetical protein
MSTTTRQRPYAAAGRPMLAEQDVAVSRPFDETRRSWKSTELWVYLASVAAVLIASQVVGDKANAPGQDYFAADKAWWMITALTIGYLISRGLSKAGTPVQARDDSRERRR